MEESPPTPNLAPDPTEAMRESLRKQVECPICYEIRRDQRIYVCVNGHHICSVCIQRVDSCPQGQCRYLIPTTRNRALEAILEMENMPFTFPCSHSSECQFKAQRKILLEHEATCEYRMVMCPHGLCSEGIALNKVLEHVKEIHSTGTLGPCSQDAAPKWTIRVHPSDGTSGIWVDSRYQKHFFICSQEYMGQVYLWMSMLADEKQSDEYVCDISLQHDGNKIKFRTPVFSIDLAKEKLWSDNNCAIINRRCLREFLATDGDIEYDPSPFFIVTFTLINEISVGIKESLRNAGKAPLSRRAIESAVDSEGLLIPELADSSAPNAYEVLVSRSHRTEAVTSRQADRVSPRLAELTLQNIQASSSQRTRDETQGRYVIPRIVDLTSQNIEASASHRAGEYGHADSTYENIYEVPLSVRASERPVAFSRPVDRFISSVASAVFRPSPPPPRKGGSNSTALPK